MALSFEWDESKNRVNKRKHGVGFEIATQVFEDPGHVVVNDPTEKGEQRWQAIGFVENALLLLVVHTLTEGDGAEFIRLISARRATRCEAQIYGEQNG